MVGCCVIAWHKCFDFCDAPSRTRAVFFGGFVPPPVAVVVASFVASVALAAATTVLLSLLYSYSTTKSAA
jgi:hypothetical protein